MAMTQPVMSVPDRSDELDQGLLADFLGPKVRVLWNLLSAQMVAALAPFGLRTGAFSTMAVLSANPGSSLTQIARAQCMDKSAVVAIVDELESRGLLIRLHPPQDRRRHALSLTKDGEALMHRMHGAVQGVGVPIRDSLSPKEMEQLMSLLDRAYEALARDASDA